MAQDTIPRRLLGQASKRGSAPAYYVKDGDAWRPTPWRQYAAQVRRAARALMALGLEHDGKICILGFNRPEWVISDVACMMAGGVPAGIYTTCSATEVQYIIDHADATVVVLEDEGQWEKVKAERGNLPKLQHAVMMRGAPPIDDPIVLSWEDFLARGDEVTDAALDQRIERLKPNEPATFIYTSGTTGPPKAVMLSHRNLTFTADAAISMVGLGGEDVSVSYLPLSHIAEQMFSIHAPITAGSQVYFAQSIEKLPDDLKEVQPTVIFGVPRIWEKFHAGVSAKLKEASGFKALLVGWARGVGRKVAAVKNRGGSTGGLLGLQYSLAGKAIFSKLKPALGLGRARVCVSGAAPIAPEILEFFASLDLIIHEVYGQSEDCGPTSFNLPGRTKFGTVGPAVPGVEVKLAADDEILVRGPNVFMGYYKDQAATDEALNKEWLHSGDLGSFDEQGYLSITGRKKEIIITAGGENIPPKNIEAALKNIELVSQAVVIGDRRKYLSALITLDASASARFAKEHGLKGALHEDAVVNQAIQEGVEGVNKLFA